ncbi:hypothetical protein EYF80_044895 [Liparis tanakae]|uniref:Uncharacterized protein n=1 Tax=Liparis tanakae TaxID=230148 RepID=A0A4Z2FVI3_9TELE|nr:hypothetical protein EYF80_044895 [Liparis tanakae]
MKLQKRPEMEGGGGGGGPGHGKQLMLTSTMERRHTTDKDTERHTGPPPRCGRSSPNSKRHHRREGAGVRTLS